MTTRTLRRPRMLAPETRCGTCLRRPPFRVSALAVHRRRRFGRDAIVRTWACCGGTWAVKVRHCAARERRAA